MKIRDILLDNIIRENPSLEEKLHIVGTAQRGAPEAAMLKVQHAMGGGVLNPVVEHIGDLTHRMCLGERQYAGYEYVKEKVDRGIKYLTSKYGFAREFNENIAGNARYNEVPEEQVRNAVVSTLKKYAEAHSKIPVYNEAQKVARQAAIDIGNMDWDSALYNLRTLDRHLDSPEEWLEYAHAGL